MKRIYESLLREYLTFFPCVALIGPRQCGKTTLLSCLSKDWKVFDLEKQSDFQVLSQDTDLFFRLNSEKVAIDEAQLRPEIFPALRVAIDRNRQQAGRFIITGSSSPKLNAAVLESLAGRIGMIEMAPFSFAEVVENTSLTFYRMLVNRATPQDLVNGLRPCADIKTVHDFWLRGGYPEPWVKNSHRFHSLWMNQYIGTYLYRDVAGLFPGINEARFRTFVQLMAGLSGTIINCSDVARSLGVSPPTVRDYFSIAHDTFLWREVSPFTKNVLKRIVKHPKGYMRDSGLLHYLLRIGNVDDLVAHPAMGRSWEGAVIEEILRGFSAVGGGIEYAYYRTGGGAEVDLVIEGEFGIIPFEIKYAQSVSPLELRGLKGFMADHQCRLGILINNDESPRLYDERIVGLPFSCLC